MNLNNILRKATGVALAGTLTLGALASNSFAANEYTGQPTGISKTLEVRDGVQIPNETFHFTVEPATPGETETGKEAAPAGFVSLANDGNITFGKDTEKTKSLGLNFDYSKISKPGIYRVAISETAGNREGMTYDTAVRNVDLYVTRTADGSLQISNVVVSNENGDKQDGNQGAAGNTAVSFKNRYGVDENGDPTDTVSDLKVGKKISNDSVLVENDKEFAFTVTIQGQVGDKYTYDGKTYEVENADTPVSFTVTAKNGQTKTISGLTNGDKVTVLETEESKKGYTSSDEIETPKALSDIPDKTVIVTNISESSVPTGIIDNVLPFVLIVVVAGGFAYLYFKKNKKEELA